MYQSFQYVPNQKDETNFLIYTDERVYITNQSNNKLHSLEIKLISNIIEENIIENSEECILEADLTPNTPSENILITNPHSYNFLQHLNIDKKKNELENSRDFFSDNASSNEIYDNSFYTSVEHSLDELRSYVSLIGISYCR